jgi:hypothetical protein
MTQTTNEPDVAAILEALRAEVRAQRAAQGGAETGTALGAIERELHHAAEQLEITRVVSAHWPLEGKGLSERAWILVHKVVRYGLRWYINPIVDQQNAFNDAAARALRLLVEANADLRDQAADLRRRLDAASPDGEGSATPPAVPAPPEAPAAEPKLERQQREALAQLEARRAVSAHWELRGPLALPQRAVRQYLRWLINPIVEQQNAYNDALAAAAPQLLAAQRELRARVAAARAARGPE